MAVLLALLVGTALAMVLLVIYGHFLFEENRTRVTRRRSSDERRATSTVETGADDIQWRTLVDPVEAANRARASQPFAAAYARAMAAAYEDSRAA